jgi:hypothetical protein
MGDLKSVWNSPQANKEERMEDTLAKLQETWAGIEFVTEPYKV